MALTLYDAVIPSYFQMLGAVAGLIDKAEAFCTEKNIPAEDIIGCRLIEDMHPFNYQVKSTAVHSLGAIEGVRTGAFQPDSTIPPSSFADLKARVQQAIEGLSQVSVEELEAAADKPVIFSIPGRFERHFTGQSFLLSFSQPNFYFHAATAYDVLRHKGVNIGKVDYLGALRITKSA